MSFIINEYNQNFDKIKFALTPIFAFFKEFEHKIRILSIKENVNIKDTKHLIVNIISLCGWQVIGINIFSLESNINKNIDSSTITEIRKSIYESIISSLENS